MLQETPFAQRLRQLARPKALKETLGIPVAGVSMKVSGIGSFNRWCVIEHGFCTSCCYVFLEWWHVITSNCWQMYIEIMLTLYIFEWAIPDRFMTIRTPDISTPKNCQGLSGSRSLRCVSSHRCSVSFSLTFTIDHGCWWVLYHQSITATFIRS